MASGPQTQFSILDRLSDETLQYIDLAMTQDSPFYIDDSYIRQAHRSGKGNSANGLESSAGWKDPLFIQVSPYAPVRQHAPQSVHCTYWIAINNTNRRIRTPGKYFFFHVKTIAMYAELPTRLSRKDSIDFRSMIKRGPNVVWPRQSILSTKIKGFHQLDP